MLCFPAWLDLGVPQAYPARSRPALGAFKPSNLRDPMGFWLDCLGLSLYGRTRYCDPLPCPRCKVEEPASHENTRADRCRWAFGEETDVRSS